MVNYEAQAAIELEQIAEPLEEGRYGFGRDAMKRIDFAPVFTGMINDWKKQVPVPIIAAKFHNAAASLVLDICIDIRKMTGLSQAALSGGVWQNRFLLERTARQLQKAGFDILLHNQVPANDGGLSLGQAMIGVHHFARLKE